MYGEDDQDPIPAAEPFGSTDNIVDEAMGQSADLSPLRSKANIGMPTS